MELGVSAILDLYELEPYARILFVKLFLNALVDAPKKLWHPVLVVIDEAHIFAPEKDKAESLSAVINLASRGRKRGFAAVLATQRIQKLNKDAASECNNKLIGRASLDLDVARAASELGFAKNRWVELKELSPGQFFASGPAFNHRGVVPVKIGKVKTTHPKAGSRIAFAGAPPTAKIRALLPKLSDLPAEAEERAKTVEDLRAEVTRLRRELDAKPKPPLPPAPLPPKLVEVPVVSQLVIEQFDRAKEEVMAAFEEVKIGLRKHARNIPKLDGGFATGPLPGAKGRPFPPPKIIPPRGPTHDMRRMITSPTIPGTQFQLKVGAGERAVLTAIAQHSDGVDREQLTVLTGYKRSTRDAYIQRLRVAGLIVDGPTITVSNAGLGVLGDDFEPLPKGVRLRDHWLGRLPSGEREILSRLISRYPQAMSREEISDATTFKRSTRDAYVQRLSSRKLVTTQHGGAVRASDNLFTD